MLHRKVKNAKMIFAIMVPLTFLAFLLGTLTVDDRFFVPGVKTFDLYDGFGGGIATLCVFFFNFLEEKP